MTNGQISSLEHMKALFDAFRAKFESDQLAQDDRFREFKNTLDKEGRLLADKYKSDLAAYPNIADFNELREKVTVEFSSAIGKAKALPLLLSIIAVLISAAGLSVMLFK